MTPAQRATFGAGANSLIAGDHFTLRTGALNFDASTGPASLSLGKGANLNGGDILMSAGGIANTLTIGDESRIATILMNGGGAKAAQTLTLGDKVVSDAGISIAGSGTAADRTEVPVTIGDGVTVNGAIRLLGINTTTLVKIGDGLTLKGAFVGAWSGAEMVEIGRDWQIDGTLNLGAGNDTLRIGTTSRDGAGLITGGAGTDTLEIALDPQQPAAFAAAAKATG
ncbi:hypothetical protein [Methylobacterium sp. ID0610]|uniref:hypothetical protein n=1 Tax=Methylobacterium carpenticola TaxID=3344827 RepID=UPI0036866B43